MNEIFSSIPKAVFFTFVRDPRSITDFNFDKVQFIFSSGLKRVWCQIKEFAEFNFNNGSCDILVSVNAYEF